MSGEQNETHSAEGVSEPGSDQSQSLICLECGKSCQRQQELDRHIQCFHLPCWIWCKYQGCTWRGDRTDDFQKHLDTKMCGQKPDESEYQIYNVKLVLSWIKDPERALPIPTARNFAIDFVKEKAIELGKQEWLNDPWGRMERRARR